jgi:DNA-binding transcriptional LysR family regulator
MNVHHLELFYHVAKNSGVAAAARNMPYGITLAAISGQIALLEDLLGTRLFERRPFVLTPAGEKLYAHVQPFFERMETVENDIRGDAGRQIRLGSSELVLRDYLPRALESLRSGFPKLKFVLRQGHQPLFENLLHRGEIDVAVTLMEQKAAEGLSSQPLFQLPLVLVVPKNSSLKKAEDLWKGGQIDRSLLCLPDANPLMKHFQQGLQHLGLDWFPAMELSSLELIESYVKNGYGVGVSVAVPKPKPVPGVRMLPLENFAPVNFGILWRGTPNPLMSAFIDAVKLRAADFV